MPNGGPDNCANCSHNRAVRELGAAGILTEELKMPRERFRERSHCTLRDVHITEPFWTYCGNFVYAPKIAEPDAQPKGWIYASGLYDHGYWRIPWHGDIEPRVVGAVRCTVCSRNAEHGIVLGATQNGGRPLGFCSNRHYIEWWKTQHLDDAIDPDHFTPQ